MACCAFALFIVGQIAAWLGGVRAYLPRRWREAPIRPNHVAAWRLDMQPAAGPVVAAWRPRRLGPWVAAAIGLEIAVMAGGAFAFGIGDPLGGAGATGFIGAADSFICSALGIERAPR